jgi:hypothetical protein
MLGLAGMALDLACMRAYGCRLRNWQPEIGWTPVDRKHAMGQPDIFSVAYHYYVICDRISRGEAP